jgi:hypothetical protein
LVNAQQAISNAMGVRGTRGIVSVALAFNRRMYARFAARFCINQQSRSWRGLSPQPLKFLVEAFRDMFEPLLRGVELVFPPPLVVVVAVPL